jgi:hypothetical protein
MLWSAVAIKGYAVEASDGQIGTVNDILFDDKNWLTRWMVVHTGSWAFGRKVLLPRSALGKPIKNLRQFPVDLTRQQVKDSPDVDVDLPVSRQMEMSVYRYYSWPPYWDSELTSMGMPAGMPMVLPFQERRELVPEQDGTATARDHGDPNLRSVMAVSATTSRQPMAHSVMPRIFGWITSMGGCSISPSTPRTGGRARKSSYRLD